MSTVRVVRLDHLIGVYAVGSGDWSWQDEHDKLIDRPVTQNLIDIIRTDGIREPVLLGSDGRVWDGHHRIIIAMHLGLDTVPVEFLGVVAEEPEWEYGVKPYPEKDEVYPAGESAARLMARRGSQDGYELMRRTKTVSAGPWVPVKQEGAGQ